MDNKITLIKFWIICISIILAANSYTFAQPVDGINYSIANPAPGGTWIPTGSLTLVHAAGTDDAVTGIVFPTFQGFYYGGNFYGTGSTVWISSNGWVSFANPGGSQPVNDLAGSTVPTVAPLWDNLKVNTGGSAGVYYRFVNSAASGYMHVEWDSMLWDNSGAVHAISFQMRIYVYSHSTKPNHIEFYYRQTGGSVGNLAGTPSASIGISGFCAGDFYSAQSQGGNFTKSFETNNINGKPSPSNFFQFIPVTHPNNTCASSYAFAFGANNPITTYDATTLHSTPSSAAACAGQWANKASDVWFTFTKPAGLTNFEVFTSNLDCRGANYKPALEVYTACGGAAVASNYGSTGPGTTNATSYVNLTGQPCAATTYFVRVANDSLYRSYFTFNVRAPGRDCAYANNISSCSLPYNSPSLQNIGFGDAVLQTTGCNSVVQSNEDYIFTYTPVSSICVNLTLSNTPANSNPGLFIYRGCPTSGGNCVGSVTGFGGSTLAFNNLTLSAGQTYYFVVDNDSSGGNPSLSNFNFGMSASILSAPAYDACGSAQPVSVNTSCILSSDYNNNCATPSAAGTIPLPGCAGFTDGVTPDVWFQFTSFNNQPHQVTVENGTSGTANDLAMAIYTGGCAGPWTLQGCDDNSNGAQPSLSVTPPGAGTVYYVRIWSNDGSKPGTFRICVVRDCSPANDLCVNSVLLTNATPQQGTNVCATGTGEPNAGSGGASCWGGAANPMNTVWYRFVATNSTMRIRCRLLTLFDSQIALYSGACGAAMTELYCNDNSVTGCTGQSYRSSEIIASGLSIGTTYYISVDGRASNTGSFEITIQQGSDPWPPVQDQDCAAPIAICNSNNFTVADPGYQGTGNICDLASGTTCLGSGERSSVWYTFSVTGPATVTAYVTPNAPTDYDMMIWLIDTVWNNYAGHQFTVPNYCSILGTPSAFPWTSCNYSASQPAGIGTSSGTVTLQTPGIPTPHQTANGTGINPALVLPANVTATFLMQVSNFTVNTSGFTMNLTGTPINSVPPSMNWQGNTSSTWNTRTNWTPPGCGGIPNCFLNNATYVQSNTIINPGPNQPVITASVDVKDITINAGATLTLNAGVTLSVCGNFTNNGTLIANAGSTVRFVGAANTSINGTFGAAANNFYNLDFAKASGATVTLNTDIYVVGRDSIYGGIVNNNNRRTEVGGNFYNYNGSTSFTGVGSGVGGSYLTFTRRSGADQVFRNDGAALTLNNVTMNQIAAGLVTLFNNATSNMILGTGGTLTLTQGIISTGTNEVNVTNSGSLACTAGNNTSYVNGFLRRAIALGAFGYDFPVGNAAQYQRANITYTTAPTATYNLLAQFKTWGGANCAFPGLGPAASECITATYDALPYFNHGYWSIDASVASPTGTYRATLYNQGMTNNGGMGWTVVKANPGTCTFSLNGACFVASTAIQTRRDNLTGFSDFATVQSQNPLPIELISFTAIADRNNVICKWVTASEINNDHFIVERSYDGLNFEFAGKINGYGPGITTVQHNYEFVDAGACKGQMYYRLKQVDIDGTTSTHDVVAVNCKANYINLFPNPAKHMLTLSFFQVAEGQVKIELTDMLGQSVKDITVQALNGFNNLDMNISELPVGVYYLKLINIDQTEFDVVKEIKFLKH